MSLFGARIILCGVADPKTVDQLSLLTGDSDRPRADPQSSDRPARLQPPPHDPPPQASSDCAKKPR